jgi:WhiB family redox-sensing transcriptional regulator
VNGFLWPQNQPWRLIAACRGMDPDVFHPPDERHDTSRARATCKKCPVWSDCLDYAIGANELLGIWGGMNRRQREVERRRRERTASG